MVDVNDRTEGAALIAVEVVVVASGVLAPITVAGMEGRRGLWLCFSHRLASSSALLLFVGVVLFEEEEERIAVVGCWVWVLCVEIGKEEELEVIAGDAAGAGVVANTAVDAKGGSRGMSCGDLVCC